MSHESIASSRLASLWVVLTLIVSTAGFAQGTTAFTYQGVLEESGKPATGTFDFEFTLFDGPEPFVAVELGVVRELDIAVTDGTFSLMLDYGPGVFDGRELWLRTCVREQDTEPLTCLTPLQQITPVPYASFALNASELGGLEVDDFLRRTAGCDLCIGHADSNGGAPERELCFDLSSDGRGNDFLQFPSDVDENDRLWFWIECP